jgi:toxin CptA
VKSPPAIGFRCRVSPTLVGATIPVAVLAIIAVSLSALPHWLRALSIAFVGGYTGTALFRLLRPRIASVLWRADGSVELVLRCDENTPAQGVVQNARIMGPLIVLTVRWPPRERAHLWLLPDNLDADTRRRLRMRLGTAAAGNLVSGNADSD